MTRDPSHREHAALPLNGSDRADHASDTNSPSPSRTAALESTDSATRHITDDFELPVARLQDAESGRWHAGRIADALGVPLADFASMLGVHGRMIDETPDGAELQAPLAAFANIVAMVQNCMGDDADRMRAWLRQPQARLGHRTPLAALETPGQAVLVEQWIAGLWLGEGE
ncbi:MAG: DUF2384 domain-containing protein [Gemmatimonadaceae bacterium]|nr:DUF2384 domain-containing protein [Gemmatimonadaceae bacterium]